MIILGIETSCDETAAAVLEVTSNKSKVTSYKILSNIIASQIEIHQKYGGIVPEVAARKHVEVIVPVIKESLEKALISPKEIDLIAVTRGPGLVTSLFVGVEAAKTLAFAWQKPLIGVNHLAGHLYSALLMANSRRAIHPAFRERRGRDYSRELKEVKFPALCLIVSGGHTELVLMKSYLDYKIIGETLDDAAGEAFDKTAKLLGLDYPGGPEISRLAKKGNPKAFDFPRPMMNSNNFDFSFSGLKTSVLYKIKDLRSQIKDLKVMQDMAAGVEQAIVDVLVEKTIRAAEKFKVKTIMLGGGVSANEKLRKTMQDRAKNVLLPEVRFSTDNGAVIALAGYYKIKVERLKIKDGWKKIEVDPNLEL
jgi:N6-L-threonylcarbamoyladenine synthase